MASSAAAVSIPKIHKILIYVLTIVPGIWALIYLLVSVAAIAHPNLLADRGESDWTSLDGWMLVFSIISLPILVLDWLAGVIYFFKFKKNFNRRPLLVVLVPLLFFILAAVVQLIFVKNS